jgi:hypothetical protein
MDEMQLANRSGLLKFANLNGVEWIWEKGMEWNGMDRDLRMEWNG